MITLTTAVDKTVTYDFQDYFIPAGTTGTVIDIIIEDGKVSFLIDFKDLDMYEWFDVNEIEEKC